MTPKPLTLKAWLKENNVPQKEFADALGFHQSKLSRLIGEKTRPSVDDALAIELATKHAVPVSSWAKEKSAAT